MFTIMFALVMFVNKIEIPVYKGPSTDSPLSVCAQCVYMLLFLHVALVSCCTFCILHHFNVALFCVVIFSCCTFLCVTLFIYCTISCCILLLLCSSHVETFFLQHFVHLAQFPEVQLWSPQTSKMESFTIIWILENIDNERKLENTTENRPYTQHPELVSLFDIP